MAHSIYISSPSAGSGKSMVALSLASALTKVVAKVGIFRPFVFDRENDLFTPLLLEHSGSHLSAEQAIGVTWDEFRADPEAGMATIIEAYRNVAREHDVVIIDGSDYDGVAGNPELTLNAQVAANIGAPTLLVVNGNQGPSEALASAQVSIKEIAAEHARVVAVVANRCKPSEREAIEYLLKSKLEGLTVTSIPEVPLLAAPSVGEVMRTIDGQLLSGDPALLEREAEDLLICAMDVSHAMERLRDGQLVVVPSDRVGIIIALAAAHASTAMPSLAGLVLNGGFPLPTVPAELIKGLSTSLPIITTNLDTFKVGLAAGSIKAHIAQGSKHKIDVAITTFEQEADVKGIMDALDVARSEVVTPLMFQSELIEHARNDRRTIVLPESEDDRVLRAADSVLRRNVANVVLLGDENAVHARATELGLNISGARIVSVHDEELLEKYATEFARLRAKKGVTLEQAREKVQDVSYFGTMMVHMGDADGMVSGAVHTTAHTIVPSFQIIKTKPGTSIVSSVFLMLLEDRVLVYGDCAVNPEPTAEQLADIAISSAETARQFGVEPRVAMLSFSTGTSGKGADVDKVRTATELVRQKAPELAVEGPIQYDAAIDPSVAATKAPGSAVAGRANVFIFPDLSSGNIGYKAVQRSSGAVAVGPILQGLNKPVNDLSRGALVEDIINTVAITAVQAQG